MINIELMNSDRDLVIEQTTLIMFYGKSTLRKANNGKATKHTKHITRRNNFLINGKECNIYKRIYCEGGM